MEIPEKLLCMAEWGTEFIEYKNEQLVGHCPFCGKEKHFYVNTKTFLWDCKVCGLAGNRNGFLEEVHRDLLRNTKESNLEKLSRFRSIPLSSLRRWKVAYCPFKNCFVIPVFKNNTVVDLRHYKLGEKVISTTGCQTDLLGRNLLSDTNRINQNVYVCAGEFDCFAMDWLLRRNGKVGTCVSPPGEGIFKKDWISLFNGRTVYICFDNDDAGIRESIKRINDLSSNTAEIHVLNWPEEFKKGYDINDWVKERAMAENANPVSAYKLLVELFTSAKSFLQKYSSPTTQPIDLPTGLDDSITLNDIFAELKQNDIFVNHNIQTAIEIAFATAISGRMTCFTNNPLWQFLVGPPGSGKTLVLSLFEKAKAFAFFQSSLKRESLISGMSLNGNDPSILNVIGNRCLVLKDFTEVLDAPPTIRTEIFATLRGAYDGSVDKLFGNGIYRAYTCNFPLLAGVTNEIYAHSTAAMGERCLKYSIQSSPEDRERLQRFALKHARRKQDQSQLAFLVNSFLSKEHDYSDAAVDQMVPAWFEDSILPLARLVGHLRTPVRRHMAGWLQNDPAYAPEPETGNRLVVQFQRLGVSLAYVLGESAVTESIYQTVKQVAMDTMRGYVLRIVDFLFMMRSSEITRKDLINCLGISSSTIQKYLEDLEILEIIERVSLPPTIGLGNRTEYAWILSKTVSDCLISLNSAEQKTGVKLYA